MRRINNVRTLQLLEKNNLNNEGRQMIEGGLYNDQNAMGLDGGRINTESNRLPEEEKEFPFDGGEYTVNGLPHLREEVVRGKEAFPGTFGNMPLRLERPGNDSIDITLKNVKILQRIDNPRENKYEPSIGDYEGRAYTLQAEIVGYPKWTTVIKYNTKNSHHAVFQFDKRD